MSERIDEWLAGRTPPSVFDLSPWTRGQAGGDVPTVLADAAASALGRTLANPGRVRESALHLLAADALITYACEAAVDAEDAEEELTRILRKVSDP